MAFEIDNGCKIIAPFLCTLFGQSECIAHLPSFVYITLFFHKCKNENRPQVTSFWSQSNHFVSANMSA